MSKKVQKEILAVGNQFYNLKALNKSVYIHMFLYQILKSDISFLQLIQSSAHGTGTFTGLTKTAFFVI